jgi:hypothetical protein
MVLAEIMRTDPNKFFPMHLAYRSLLIYLLTPKLVLRLGKIPRIYGTRRFIIVFKWVIPAVLHRIINTGTVMSNTTLSCC